MHIEYLLLFVATSLCLIKLQVGRNVRLCLIISDGIKTIAIDQTAITLPFRSSSTASFVLNGKEICQKGCCAFRVFVFLTERTFLLVFSRFRRGRRGCSSSLTEVFNTTQNNSRYATISFKNLTIYLMENVRIKRHLQVPTGRFKCGFEGHRQNILLAMRFC